MKKRTFFLYVGYVWTKTLLGLVVHPHKSIQEVTRRTILLPTIFSPLLALCGFFIVGRIMSWVIELDGFLRSFVAAIASAALISILLWQLLLLYMLAVLIFVKQKNL